jgi:hypothetical protein
MGEFAIAAAAAFLTNPIGLFILAVAAVIALAVLLIQNWDTVKAFFAQVWNEMGTLAQKAAADIKSAWAGIAEFFTQIGQAIIGGATNVWNSVLDVVKTVTEAIASLWQSAVDAVVNAWNGAVSSIGGYIQGIIDWINKAIQAAKELASAIFGGGTEGAAAGSGAGGFARGGHVQGPGSPMSDSILAWLSNGEFVMRAAAVQKYGTHMMAAINSLAFPRFASGGLVGGGAGGSRHVLNLTIGSETFSGLMVPEHTAEKLSQFAVSRKMSSTGYKPRWYR